MTAYDLVRSASTAVLVLRSAATSRPAHESWRRRGAAAGRVWCVGGALGVGEGGRRWLALEGAPTYPLTTSYHLVARTSGHHRPKAVRRRPQQARPDRGTAQPNSFAASRGEIEDRTWPSSTTPLLYYCNAPAHSEHRALPSPSNAVVARVRGHATGQRHAGFGIARKEQVALR